MQEPWLILGQTLHPYGLIIAIAAAALLLWMGIAGYKRRLPIGTVRIFGILAIVFGIFFSRLFFCLFNLSLFTETYENPWLMLCFWDGGLSMCGLLTGLVVAAWLAAKLMNIRLGTLLDTLTPPLGLFLAACRAAEYFTDLGVGKVVEEGIGTQLFPWLFLQEAAGIATEYRLAVFAYEAAAGVLIALWMLLFTRSIRKSRTTRPGDLSLLFFSLYGTVQMLLESMRDDGHMLITFLRVSQVFAALLPLTAAAIWSRRYIRVRQQGDKRIIISWLLLLGCVALGILLEFSLDGRLTIGTPSMLRDYGIMLVLCAMLFAIPYSLFSALRKKGGRSGSIRVRI